MFDRTSGDEDGWTEAGRRLREADPRRYAELLAVVRRMVAICDDPVAAMRAAVADDVSTDETSTDA